MTTDRKKLLMYLLIVLAVARFVAAPAAAMLDEKKALYEDTLNAKKTKMQLLARQTEAAAEATAENTSHIMAQFYPESAHKTAMETNITDWLTKVAESKGLVIINFQYLEETRYPDYIEEPVIFRMTGQMKKIFELLREINERQPMLAIRKFELEEQRDDYRLTLMVSGYMRSSGVGTPHVPGRASK
jgi:Tfp pilus assembly protein PilO